MQRDPIGNFDSENLYQYVDSVGKPINETNPYVYTGNNPVNRIDPLGLWYIDLNLSYFTPWLVGGTSGVLINNKGIWKYGGGGVGTTGGGASLTFSFQNPSTGWNSGTQAGFLLGGQAGFDNNLDWFFEGGFVWPPGGK